MNVHITLYMFSLYKNCFYIILQFYHSFTTDDITIILIIIICGMRLILDSYIRQKARVTWNSIKSSYFNITTGVKQGGMISPIFYPIFKSNIA